MRPGGAFPADPSGYFKTPSSFLSFVPNCGTKDEPSFPPQAPHSWLSPGPSNFLCAQQKAAALSPAAVALGTEQSWEFTPSMEVAASSLLHPPCTDSSPLFSSSTCCWRHWREQGSPPFVQWEQGMREEGINIQEISASQHSAPAASVECHPQPAFPFSPLPSCLSCFQPQVQHLCWQHFDFIPPSTPVPLLKRRK